MMTALELIDAIAPVHGRTTCSPTDNWSTNAYFSETGHSRCVRCALLHKIETGEFPYAAQMICESIRAANFGEHPLYGI